VIKRDDRQHSAERERARIAHEHLGGMDVEPQEPEDRADDDRAHQRQVRLDDRLVEQRDQQVADEGEDQGAARQSVEAVGQVDAVAGSRRSPRPRRR
jgi:hypothetical protein